MEIINNNLYYKSNSQSKSEQNLIKTDEDSIIINDDNDENYNNNKKLENKIKKLIDLKNKEIEHEHNFQYLNNDEYYTTKGKTSNNKHILKKAEENGKEYTLRISSTDNKIKLNLSTRDKVQFKNYSGEFTLDDLRNINKVFLLTQSIYEAKEEFKKAIERKKIEISERDDYIHVVFYMMIGTDTSTLSIALPRDETPRINR